MTLVSFDDDLDWEFALIRALGILRDTWTDGPLAKKKKQERLIGFFYYGMRLGWIKSNSAALLGRIRAEGPPTDYFSKSRIRSDRRFNLHLSAKGWAECRNQATRLRVLILLLRWSGTPKRCHPHVFRDTFAVEMLLAGVPLEQISILLGHKSVKITEKNYAPWVKARQDQLAANPNGLAPVRCG